MEQAIRGFADPDANRRIWDEICALTAAGKK